MLAQQSIKGGKKNIQKADPTFLVYVEREVVAIDRVAKLARSSFPGAFKHQFTNPSQKEYITGDTWKKKYSSNHIKCNSCNHETNNFHRLYVSLKMMFEFSLQKNKTFIRIQNRNGKWRTGTQSMGQIQDNIL